MLANPLPGVVEVEDAGLFYQAPVGGLIGQDPQMSFLRFLTATPQDDFFTSASLDPKWSWVNQNGSTATFPSQRLKLAVPATGNPANNNLSLLVQAVPAGSWTCLTLLHNASQIANCGGGLVVYRSVGTTILSMGVVCRVSGAVTSCRLFSEYWSSVTTAAGNVRDNNPPLLEERSWWMQMRYDGTTLYLDYSPDGVTFFAQDSIAAATALGGAPTHFGFFGNGPSASTGATLDFDVFKAYHDASLNHS